MNTLQENKVIPQLRFKEFNYEWNIKFLSDLALRITEKNNTNSIKTVLTNSALKGIISQSDYFDRDIVNKNNLDRYYIVKIGDYVYNPRISKLAPVGPIKKNNLVVGLMSPLYSVFRFNQNENDFFEYYFESTVWHRYMKSVANYGARHDRMNISTKDFFKMPIAVPSNFEQQKIALFISAVDEKLQRLSKKKELLEDYKKGIMQKIFSQEIRFKDDSGNEYPDWEEKKLGQIGTFISGTGFSNSEQGGVKGIPFLKVSDMNLKGNEYSITNANNYVNKEQISRLKYKVINNFSIIFAKVGAAIFLERKRIASNFLIDNNMMSFTPSGNIIFFKNLFEMIRLSKFAQVGALPSYNASDLKTIKIVLPKSSDEQEKIGEFLSEIDKKIKLVNNQLEKTKEFKKGLLQQMFV